MTMKNIGLIVFCLLVCALSGCKPTEQNYRAAYDAAQEKRKAAAARDEDSGVIPGVMQRFGEPVKKVVNGDTLNVSHEYLHFEGGTENVMHRWNVAVAKYKMPTNCASQSSRLAGDGYPAFYVKGSQGSYYVIASSFETLDDAAKFVKEYVRKHKNTAYIGLDGSPLIIER